VAPTLTPAFPEAPGGRLFVLEVAPAAAPRGRVVVVPAFGEEMNRTRRMLFALAEQLADRGHAVTLADPFGTGDSQGRFAEATWEGWLADLGWLLNRAAARSGAPVTVVAVRAGVLLAAEAVAAQPEVCAELVCVQPVSDGKRYLDQLLRTRVAAAMSRGRRTDRATFWAHWAAGETVEIGGYEISAPMAAELGARRLADLVPPAGLPIVWARLSDAPGSAAASAAGPRCPDSWARATLREVQVPAGQLWALAEAPGAVAAGRRLADHIRLEAAA
jgi:exosortase A-associated hydrolase 2